MNFDIAQGLYCLGKGYDCRNVEVMVVARCCNDPTLHTAARIYVEKQTAEIIIRSRLVKTFSIF